MSFHEDSLAVRVLAYLFRQGEMPRKSLKIPFGEEFADRYYQRTIKTLIDEEYIRCFKYKRVNYVALTPKGDKYVKENSEPCVAQQKCKNTNKKKAQRQALVNSVIGLCVANEFATGEDEKPSLRSLFPLVGPNTKPEDYESESNRCVAEYEESAEEFRDILESNRCIFYSSKEIRTAYIETIGKNEIMNVSRLVGVVFGQQSISYIYSINEKLIKWMASCEDRTIATIQKFFSMSPVILENTPSVKEISGDRLRMQRQCIILGKGNTMIPKIVFGRKYGRIVEDDHSECRKANIAKDHINSHNIEKVFQTALYVPKEMHGKDIFSFCCKLNPQKIEAIQNNWYARVKNVRRAKALWGHQGYTSKNERVIYMPYINLIELEHYKNQNERCHFVIPNGYQEAISRVMGPLLIDAKNFDGTPLSFNRYDKNGMKIGDDKNAG